MSTLIFLTMKEKEFWIKKVERGRGRESMRFYKFFIKINKYRIRLNRTRQITIIFGYVYNKKVSGVTLR